MTTGISFAAALRLATLALLVPVVPAFAVTGTDATSVSQVLHEVRAHAAEANYDAEILETFTRSGVPWQTHAQRLNQIRDHVKDLLQDYSRLQTIADRATPKQREAINRLEPMLREMADSLTNTIETLNKNQSQANMPPFRARIHSDYLNINKIYRELCKCTDAKSEG